MGKIICIIVLILWTTASLQGQQKIKGSGYVLTQQREVAYFNSITVSSQISVYIVQGEFQPITVEADNNLFPYIKTVVRNKTLKIYVPDTVNITRFADMNVLISMPHLSTLIARQSSYIDGSPQKWETEEVTLKAASGSRIKLATDATTITVDGKTSATVELKGKTDMLTTELTTGAKLIARELETEKADLELATRARAEVRVNQQIAYDLSGNARLVIKGDPKVLKAEVNSGSKVTRDK